MHYCSNCGKEVVGDSSFCGHCGNKIADSPTAHPSSPGAAPINVQPELAEEAQRNAASPVLEEKKRAKTIMTIAILGGIVIVLIIIALAMSKSNISNKTAVNQTQGARQGVNSEELSQTNPQNSYPENAENMESLKPKVFQRHGIVAGGNPLIETDKDIYNYGEKIRVHYYNAPGYPRDWICIVPAGSRNTAAGNYQYIPRGGRGVLIFRSPRPGRYEARAYYSYSPREYAVSARYGFTVQNR
jgi:zinc-ribbon domain